MLTRSRKAGLILVGCVGFWGGLFGFLGAMTRQTALGIVSGGVSGFVVGLGLLTRSVGTSVFWLGLFAAPGAVIGPGYDANALTSALLFGAFGLGLGAWLDPHFLSGSAASRGKHRSTVSKAMTESLLNEND